jgi:hypothetical protein
MADLIALQETFIMEGYSTVSLRLLGIGGWNAMRWPGEV